MSGIWGSKIKLSIFGESHGPAIGITIDGLEPGFSIDMDAVDYELARRAPGGNNLSTTRKEGDSVEILSGMFQGKTTGAPLCAMIRNTSQRSGDYDKSVSKLRPSHADYTGHVRYNGFNDYRGGGHFSGRITAPLVFAGALCRQILMQHGVVIGSHVSSIGGVQDQRFDLAAIDTELLHTLHEMELPVICQEAGQLMRDEILKAKSEKDSIGGTVECAVLKLAAGIGDPFFDSLESKLSQLLFSIPGVKGVEFGTGFELSAMRGSDANDCFVLQESKISTQTNHNGGILGGITNGMPVVFRVALKPTPSIAKVQHTVDIADMQETELAIVGRHDPCIVLRALPVIEAAAAIAVLDLMRL